MNSSLANCVAWVDGDEVFYKTIKPIRKDQELYVYPTLIPQNTNRNDSMFYFKFKILQFITVLKRKKREGILEFSNTN